jgi:hypothetical protein
LIDTSLQRPALKQVFIYMNAKKNILRFWT